MIRRLRFSRMPVGVAIFAIVCVAANSQAAIILGNWESGTPEGWIDWSAGQVPLGSTLISNARFDFNSVGATLGSGAVQYNHVTEFSYTQWAALKLQAGSNGGVGEWRDDFLRKTRLAFDLTFVQAEQPVAASNDFTTIGGFINADGYGFTALPAPLSVTPFVGYNGGNNFNPNLLPAGSTQTSTWVYDISTTHDGNAGNGEIVTNPNYIEIILDTYSNGRVVMHIDNVRLYVPEPTSLGFLGIASAMVTLARGRRC